MTTANATPVSNEIPKVTQTSHDDEVPLSSSSSSSSSAAVSDDQAMKKGRRLTLSPANSANIDNNSVNEKKRDLGGINNGNNSDEDDNLDDDNEEADDDTSKRALKRLKPLFSKMHANLPRLAIQLLSKDEDRIIQALKKLEIIFKEENHEARTTMAFFRACWPAYIIHAMTSSYNDASSSSSSSSTPSSLKNENENSEKKSSVQRSGLQVLYQLSLRRNITYDTVAGGYDSIKTTLVSVGAVDAALGATKTIPEQDLTPEIASMILGIVNNLLRVYSFHHFFDLGIITKTIEIMKQFPDDKIVQKPAIAVLLLAKRTPGAEAKRFDEENAVTTLSAVVERFSGKDDDVRDKAAAALRSILMPKSSCITSTDGDVSSDDEQTK